MAFNVGHCDLNKKKKDFHAWYLCLVFKYKYLKKLLNKDAIILQVNYNIFSLKKKNI